jgi:hypothetical protein
MFPLPSRRKWFTARVVLAVFVASVASASADDEQEAKRRMDYMQAAVKSLELKSSELKPKALEVGAKPLLRYSDPTRGKEATVNNILLDAGVWRLGSEGRPTALVTLEIYQRADGTGVLSYEFLSLTETKFSLKHKTEAVNWDATASGLTLKEFPEAPKPAATAAGRLTQMRQLARRFGAKEYFNDEWTECRLLTQPLDRYHSEAEKITDGAIFTLANGTNPEIGILLETDGARWQYGILRLCGAAAKVTLDDKEIVTYEKFLPRGRRDGPYNIGWHKIEMSK